MIYLDSAATSYQKPRTVMQAVMRAMSNCASPGRGSHEPAMRAADEVFEFRSIAADFFGMDSPENVILTMNATHALNIALNSLVRAGDRVVISGFEHNAVTRPLHALGARMDVIRTPLFDREAILKGFENRIDGASCVVCTQVSNVFGYILPIKEIAGLCREAEVPLVVDASQGAGILPLRMKELGAEFAAMPGHKGLLGPQGTGILLCRDSAVPLLYGGTGSGSTEQSMPDYLPDRLEAGTHNVPGAAGLRAGLEAVRGMGLTRILAHERNLMRLMADRLNRISGLRVFLSEDPEAQCGVLSIFPMRCSCEALAEALGEHGIAVRAGLHCAPLAHETAGTRETGTLRFSFSPFNTPGEVLRSAEITARIMSNM